MGEAVEGREILVGCLLVVGDQAELQIPGEDEPARWPVAQILADVGGDVYLPGRQLVVRVRENREEGRVFSGFRLAGPVPDWAGGAAPDTAEGQALLAQIAQRIDRVEQWAVNPQALALRPDVFPGVTAVLGVRVVRLAEDAPLSWGVIV